MKNSRYRPLDELKIVAPTIYNTYLRDRIQDEWFVKSGKKLLRVTDIQWHSYCDSNDFSNIEHALGG